MSRSNPTRITLAALLAGAAALLTVLYVGRADGRSTGSSAALVTVYVAKHDVAIGTAGAAAVADGVFRPQQLPRAQVLPDAVTRPAELASLVAIQPIFAGEQATLRRFGAAGLEGVRTDLRGTMRALTVSGTTEQLLAGTLADGDHVDVIAALKRGNAQTPYGRIVLRDVLVLRAPKPAAEGSRLSGSGDATSATVRLGDDQALTLFFVLKNGDWTFALRPAVHARDSAAAVASAATVLQGR